MNVAKIPSIRRRMKKWLKKNHCPRENVKVKWF